MCRARTWSATRVLALEPLETRVVPAFYPPLNFAGGLDPLAMAVGDFNGDGSNDLAVVNYELDGTVSVLRGNGDGTFQPVESYPVGSNPQGVTVGDFNDDTILDLVTADDQSGTVTALLGNGDGTFQPGRASHAGFRPVAVATGDFNSDDIEDLTVANFGTSPQYSDSRVSVLLGNGDGTFQAPSALVAGRGPNSVVVADFNQDGKQDVAAANVASLNVSVFLGNGDGSFRSASNFAAGPGPNSLVLGEFNGDGNVDLAVRNGINTVNVILGNGDGSFQTPRSITVGQFPRKLVVADFTYDGWQDLAVVSTPGVTLLRGNGDGTFRNVDPVYAAGSRPEALLGEDFNRDGWTDLVVANFDSDDISVLLNDANWPGGPVAYFYVYPDTAAVIAGQPLDVAVLALNASFSLVPEYVGEILFVTTDAQGTTPGQYTFQPKDQGIAAFPGGVTLRTPGQQVLLVLDTATFSIFGFAIFDVMAPLRGGPAPAPAIDLYATELLNNMCRPVRR